MEKREGKLALEATVEMLLLAGYSEKDILYTVRRITARKALIKLQENK